MIILLLPRWRLFVDCTQYLRLSCLMTVDEALSSGWDEDACCNHSLLLSLWKFSLLWPALLTRPGRRVWRVVWRYIGDWSAFLPPVDWLIKSQQLSSCLGGTVCYWLIWWEKEIIRTLKAEKEICDSLKWSEWVWWYTDITEYFMGCSLTETPYCSWLLLLYNVLQ